MKEWSVADNQVRAFNLKYRELHGHAKPGWIQEVAPDAPHYCNSIDLMLQGWRLLCLVRVLIFFYRVGSNCRVFVGQTNSAAVLEALSH